MVDLMMTIERPPGPGGAALADSPRATPGGGFNVMAAVVREGAAGCVGGFAAEHGAAHG